MKTIYIAGPVKGRDFDQVQAQFKAVQTKLETENFKVLNPVEIIIETNDYRSANGMEPLTDDEPRHRRVILSHTISVMMAKADEVYMMPNWKDSFGATLERDIAMRLEIPIVYM